MSNTAMIERVRKLFAKAESTTSEYERDALLTKAYDLLAKHGIEEALARESADSEAETVRTWTFTAKGSYKVDQILLVYRVARALHCHGLRSGDTLTVWGVGRHLDRVSTLGGFLVAYMLGNLATLRAPEGIATTTFRKSAMEAFGYTVHARLTEAERKAQAESGDSVGVELVLVGDDSKAEQAMNNAHPHARKGAARKVSSVGFQTGSEHGNRVILGGSELSNRQKALSA